MMGLVQVASLWSEAVGLLVTFGALHMSVWTCGPSLLAYRNMDGVTWQVFALSAPRWPLWLSLPVTAYCTVCVLVIQLFLTLCEPHGLYPAKLLCPWNSPGMEPNEFIYYLFTQSIQFRLRIRKQCFEIMRIWILSAFLVIPFTALFLLLLSPQSFFPQTRKLCSIGRVKRQGFPNGKWEDNAHLLLNFLIYQTHKVTAHWQLWYPVVFINDTFNCYMNHRW